MSNTITVVRLRTDKWVGRDGNSVHIRRSITLMKRMSHQPWIWEDVSMSGAEVFIDSITNLGQCADGLYQLVICNANTDLETGYVDDYDYKLIPYQPEDAA